jgi:hypothetical protein
MRLVGILLLGGAASGCLLGHTEHFELDNTGKTCAFAGPPTALPEQQHYMAGNPLVFVTTLDECLSACSLNVQAACDIVRSGNILHITGHGSWSERNEPGQACVDSCLVLGATCTTRPLEAGTYTIDYDGTTAAITIPSTATDAPCATTPARL